MRKAKDSERCRFLQQRMGLGGAILAMALTLALPGCGGSESADTSSTPSPSPSQAPGFADEDAARAAGEFLTAIGDGRPLAAYRLLTTEAQTSLSYEQFAADRDFRHSTGRGLALANVVSTSREGDIVMVKANGRRSGGTPVELIVPTVLTPNGWRVQSVPTGI